MAGLAPMAAGLGRFEVGCALEGLVQVLVAGLAGIRAGIFGHRGRWRTSLLAFVGLAPGTGSEGRPGQQDQYKCPYDQWGEKGGPALQLNLELINRELSNVWVHQPRWSCRQGAAPEKGTLTKRRRETRIAATPATAGRASILHSRSPARTFA